MYSSRFNSKSSPLWKSAVGALRRLLEAEGTNGVESAYAEAVADRHEEDWIARRALKLHRGHCCVNRLLGKRCQHGRAYLPLGSGTLVVATQSAGTIEIPKGDHLSEWTHNGKTDVILSQPYGLTYKGIKETVAFCERYGLEASIDTWPSFHLPGAVLSVEYSRRHRGDD